ncbi:GNAT family N-acetyltransferase [Chitinimonas lacunae]|uniref:GNAT family N-acetyltransferase n=1 Tax=Chitinimonas lacunae TaxID=1963018 RepID=A0ABV8MXR3_9NEIS
MKLLFRAPTEADWPVIRRNFALAFHRPRPQAVWDWIYRDAPDGACAMAAFDAENGALAAFYGATRHRALYRGQPFWLGQIRDVFSHPAYRGGRRGPFVQTAEAFFERYTGAGDERMALLYGFPSETSYRIGELMLHYRRLPAAALWHCPAPSPEAYAFGSEAVLEQVDGFGEESERLWRQRESAVVLGLVRNARFLDWRFAAQSGRQYLKLLIRRYDESGAAGYLVTRTMGREAWLVDACLPADFTAARLAWERLTARLALQGVRRISTWALPSQQASLARLGFGQGGWTPPVFPTYRLFDSSCSEAEVEAVLGFNMADADIF